MYVSTQDTEYLVCTDCTSSSATACIQRQPNACWFYSLFVFLTVFECTFENKVYSKVILNNFITQVDKRQQTQHKGK